MKIESHYPIFSFEDFKKVCDDYFVTLKSENQNTYGLSSLPENIVSAFIIFSLRYLYSLKKNEFFTVYVVVKEEEKEALLQLLETDLELTTHFEICTLSHMSWWGEERFFLQYENQSARSRFLTASVLKKKPIICLTTPLALGTKFPSLDYWQSKLYFLEKDKTLDPSTLEELLQSYGYKTEGRVEAKGQWQWRGGIVDIFVPYYDKPLRLEFIDDKISSIRFFDPISFRSLEELENCIIHPFREFDVNLENFEGTKQKLYDSLLEIETPRAARDLILEEFSTTFDFQGIDLFQESFSEHTKKSIPELSASQNYFFFLQHSSNMIDTLQAKLGKYEDDFKLDKEKSLATLSPYLFFEDSKFFSKLFTPSKEIEIPFVWQNRKPTQLEDYLREHEQEKLVFCSDDDHLLSRFENLLNERTLNFKIDANFISKIFSAPFLNQTLERSPHQLYLSRSSLESPIFLKDQEILIYPISKIFGQTKKGKKTSKKTIRDVFEFLKELKPGDFVVHEEYGISRFNGLVKLEVSALVSEFAVLEFARKDVIYVPVDKIGVIQKYVSPQQDSSTQTPISSSVKLDELGSPQWIRKKSTATKAAKDIADKLLAVEAKRKLQKTEALRPPDEEYYRFEAGFTYIETEDQKKAIDDVNLDLSTSVPMDRLICGDVGFGKTEVALRAAFRSVSANRQVLILAPTTILAYQHFLSFNERMRAFGVNIGLANRFVKPSQLKDTLEKFNEGLCDILIGTHRVLSKDVHPKRLGLVVIDEEQRFGVEQKEKIKELAPAVPFLTLSATPIPRTLNLALLGLKDVSVISTPPPNRLPVKTLISSFDDALLTEAIQRELTRQGQVFFVHNKIQDIQEIATKIGRLVPHARILVAHGQLTETKLEDTIYSFLNHKADILLCTTIIESGVDMPRVNTLIVNQAENYGLSQLHQLRGRVGRSSRQAYAYFFTKPEERLSEESKKRLDAIARHQQLGSGFYIANQDLEIRGSGNILGTDQSGYMREVGYDYYMKMLERAISEARGQTDSALPEPEIKLPIRTRIPEIYISEEKRRIFYYKKIFGVESDENLDEVLSLMADEFGQAPTEIHTLISISRLKILLRHLKAEQLFIGEHGFIEISFHKSLTESNTSSIRDLAQKNPKDFTWIKPHRLICNYSVQISKETPQLEVHNMLNLLWNHLKKHLL